MHPLDVMVFGPMIIGLAFWPAIFFWSVVGSIFVLLCFDQGWISGVVLGVAVAAAYYLGFWSVGFIVEYHVAFLWLLAFYIPIGILWSTVKWWFYTTGVARKVERYLSDQSRTLKGQPDFDDRMRRVRDNLEGRFEALPPWVSNHKADLCRWMAWWPFSMLGSIFDDMLRRFFTAIYNAMSAVWQGISNHAFRNVQFANPPERTAEQIADKRVA